MMTKTEIPTNGLRWSKRGTLQQTYMIQHFKAVGTAVVLDRVDYEWRDVPYEDESHEDNNEQENKG